MGWANFYVHPMWRRREHYECMWNYIILELMLKNIKIQIIFILKIVDKF